jgi:putative transposase
MQRTIRLQLRPTENQTQALTETLRQFTQAFNQVCAVGWSTGEKNGVRLHHLTYRDTKTAYPGLVADLLIQARVKATEALKSAFARRKAGRKTRCPQSQLCAARYNVHTYKLHWQTQSVRLSTTGGRLTVPFKLPSYATKYGGCAVDTADLIWRNGRFWLHVVVTVPDVAFSPNGQTVGVDLGLNHPAVTSTARFLGKRRWKNVDQRYFRLMRALQFKGTKSAKRHLRRLRKRRMRFHRDCDHVLSRQIVTSCTPGTTLVVENLTEIRQRVRQRKGQQQRRLHSWSFAQLRSFLTYKAAEWGKQVVAVDPRHTSQTCSRCGYRHRSNRRSQSLFLCRQCGYTLNADLNGARNIAHKHLVSLSTSLADGPLSIGLSSPQNLTGLCEGQAPSL